MARIHCSELGIANCDWIASGETPGDVIDEVVAHLRDDHGIDMPDTETILEGNYIENPVMDDADEGVVIMIRRLRETLGLERRTTGLDAPSVMAPPPQT
jgi:predicted small metal-binding protein